MITRLKEVFRVAPSGRFRPGSSAEQFLATSLCLLLAATPALLIWAVTLPASEAAVITWIASTPISPSFIELSVYQWHGLLRNAALQTSWRDLDAVLQRRLPAVQPFTGASFGPLSSNAQAELPSVAGPHTASAGDQDHAENVLKRVAATNRDSLAAQYLLARWYLANGEASRAFRIADDFVRRPSNVWLPVLPPAQAYASLGPGAAQQREVAAHILIRYLAGQAAILSHVPDQAIPHLRIAIGYANYIEQVANEPGPANARAVDLLSGAAASLLEDEPATAITTMSLYDSLIVAYLRTPAYHDTVTLRSRELLRRPGQQPDGDALYAIITESTRDPLLPIPEHVLWAISNLQRISVENERRLPAIHLALDAGISWLLTERPEYLGKSVDEQRKANLRARARDRLGRAWLAASGDAHQTPDVLRPLLGWSGLLLESDETEVRRLAEMDNGLLLLVEAGGLLTEWKPLVHTAKWTLQAKDGGLGQMLEDVAAARVGRGDAGANFVRRDDRHWLEAWYGTLLNAYVLPLRDEVHLQLNTDDTDGDALEDSMPVFLALTQATGHSAYQLLRARLSERESLSWTVTRQTMVSDYRTWIVATTATAGLLVFYLLWSLYLNLCRYRMVMHGRFYRDEHLWLR